MYTQEMILQLCELTVAILSPLYALQPTHLRGSSVLTQALCVISSPVAICHKVDLLRLLPNT